MTLWNRTSLWIGERLADLASYLIRVSDLSLPLGFWLAQRLLSWWRIPAARRRGAAADPSEAELQARFDANEEIYRMWAERQ